MAGIRKNGKAYDSGDAVINILGQQEDEVVAISYNTRQAHQANKSLANEPTSWSMGEVARDCRVTLYMNAVRKLEKLAGGDLLRLAPFDINVTFVNEFNEIVNDTISCKFMDQGRDVNGEMGLKREYEMFVLDIDYNNA